MAFMVCTVFKCDRLPTRTLFLLQGSSSSTSTTEYIVRVPKWVTHVNIQRDLCAQDLPYVTVLHVFMCVLVILGVTWRRACAWLLEDELNSLRHANELSSVMLHNNSLYSSFFFSLHRNTSKKYNIMAFNAGDRVNCSTWTQVGFIL